jgi:hypothetical protein
LILLIVFLKIINTNFLEQKKEEKKEVAVIVV